MPVWLSTTRDIWAGEELLLERILPGVPTPPASPEHEDHEGALGKLCADHECTLDGDVPPAKPRSADEQFARHQARLAVVNLHKARQEHAREVAEAAGKILEQERELIALRAKAELMEALFKESGGISAVLARRGLEVGASAGVEPPPADAGGRRKLSAHGEDVADESAPPEKVTEEVYSISKIR